ncbi:hypothetical protein JHK84_043246 [Glycine max]|nr:hypothetical protein JHK86_043057 [Glycine max]KAG5117133.1 hypothetical protein JHK84_043246 [Glycine max]
MNLTGEGKFGEVYKGLLQHGILVAIKKCRGLASQEFVHEVIRMNNVPIASDEFQVVQSLCIARQRAETRAESLRNERIVGSNGMLDDWEENLAVITANKTKGDELRTELYEYSKVVGNSPFTLHPFQPYKLIYAFMLAEVGKVSDSFNVHGGYAANLTPTKLVGKLLNLFDSTAHRVVGGLRPPAP